MKAPEDWTIDDLHLHLQHAVDLELWTIPLYLSAVYSIKDLDQIENKADYPEAANLILSVVIQEMLHLELVSNLSRAVGYTPEFKHPEYEKLDSIPFIHPTPADLPVSIRDYKIAVGALDKEQIKLFCAIEFPDEPSNLQWSEREEYDSIGELYEALKIGLSTLWNEAYTPGAQVAPQFLGYTKKKKVHVGFSQEITDLESALNAIEAIIGQGEGVSHGDVPRDFQPPQKQGGQFDPGWFEPTLSHYEKFHIILEHADFPPTYPVLEETSAQSDEAQLELSRNFSAVLSALADSFSGESTNMAAGFYDTMFNLSKSIAAVWRAGRIPKFHNPK